MVPKDRQRERVKQRQTERGRGSNGGEKEGLRASENVRVPVTAYRTRCVRVIVQFFLPQTLRVYLTLRAYEPTSP